ncbi:uracil phosphoribosyltransferase [Lojkania enalia]|uniref:Uracil phosphoribosyltransferase n=1 Tax=Lojkania enalia TaxID=147567 RepID=A0A9P4MUC4_9PLEO|nr:uracil phosphoribosyltransferase [Didymosphaeria enalia]
MDTAEEIPIATAKPVIIGLYGLSGAGKTYLIDRLKHALEEENFTFYDGSTVIGAVVPGGIEAFKELDTNEQNHFRARAIKKIRDQCAERKTIGVVAGHLFLENEDRQGEWERVVTQCDLETYTHIIYLDVDAETIINRRQGDTKRTRPFISVEELKMMKEQEKSELTVLCRENRIQYSILAPRRGESLEESLIMRLRDFKGHNEVENISRVERLVDEIMYTESDQLRTVLIFDGDKTLSIEDTGKQFWKIAPEKSSDTAHDPLEEIFASPLQYSYHAFRQAMYLYQDTFNDEEFEAACKSVAKKVSVRPEILNLLKGIMDTQYVGAMVVTCGLRRVWEIVLKNIGLSERVKVIGGNRIKDYYVVTPEVKAAVVIRLRDFHQLYVCAFGDSPLDIAMLKEADQSFVVVGTEVGRSKRMDVELKRAIENDGLHVGQILTPSTVSPRLPGMLKIIPIEDQGFIDSMFDRRGLHIFHKTTDPATKILATKMRDPANRGPNLCKHHRRAGQDLTETFITKLLGLQEYTLQSVQGSKTQGFRLLGEENTAIVPILRGGAPMAEGVWKILTCAAFLHAKVPSDLGPKHLEPHHTVILVDSVINNGTTIVEFVEHIREINPEIRIIVAAGVVQASSIAKGSKLWAIARVSKLEITALRISENKYTGKGATDTGHRLFNTTYID